MSGLVPTTSLFCTVLALAGCTPKGDTDTAAEQPTDTQPPEDTEPPCEFEYDDDATICGIVELEADDGCPTMPTSVSVATTRVDEYPCREDSGISNWQDEVVDQPAVECAAFQSKVPVGLYGVTGYAGSCEGCEPVRVEEDGCEYITLLLGNWSSVDAPNIYLYPEAPTATRVRLPRVGDLTATDPEYPRGGWDVLAFPDGRLDTVEGERDYLFYEMRMPASEFQRDEGWCVEGHLAQASIEIAMEEMGFLDNEIADFAEFWDVEFPWAPMLTVYPQIETLPWLGINPAPDHLLRAWFVVRRGCHEAESLVLPVVPRTGYHAAEWGVAVLPPLEGADVLVMGW